MNFSTEVQHIYNGLTWAEKQTFEKKFKKLRKKKRVAFLAWLMGWHYAYVKEWGTQMLFWFTCGGLGIWAFIDLFRIGKITRRANDEIAEDIIAKINMLSK